MESVSLAERLLQRTQEENLDEVPKRFLLLLSSVDVEVPLDDLELDCIFFRTSRSGAGQVTVSPDSYTRVDRTLGRKKGWECRPT